MDKEITLQYKPNFDTLAKVQRHLALASPWIIYFITIVVFIGLNAITDKNSGLNNKEKEASIIVFLPMIFIIIIFIGLKFFKKRTITKRFLSNPKNQEAQELIFNSESFTQIGDTFNIKYPWNQIAKIKETKEWFLIYLTKTTAFPITKSDLKETQYNQLKALFNSLDIKKSLK